jgi:hypothetical protein
LRSKRRSGNLKGELAKLLHELATHVEARIFIAALTYCLHVSGMEL